MLMVDFKSIIKREKNYFEMVDTFYLVSLSKERGLNATRHQDMLSCTLKTLKMVWKTCREW